MGPRPTRQDVNDGEAPDRSSTLGNRPFLLGLLLAPPGAFIGLLAGYVAHGVQSGWPDGHLFVPILPFGLIYGVPMASVVTLLLFPFMHLWRPASWVYPMAGAIAGLLLCLALIGELALAGLAGGFVTGLVFGWVNATTRLPGEDAPPRQGAAS